MPRSSRIGVVVAAALVGAAPAHAGTSILIKGSDTMMILAQRWSETYVRWYHCADIVVTGGGSAFGIASVLDGGADIGAVSRPLRADEERRLAGAQVITVARDGVALFVNDANPVGDLTLADARGILTGTITNWSQVGGPDAPIEVYSRQPGSGTAVFLRDHLLGGQDFSPRAHALPGSEAIVAAVQADRWGIGYSGCAYAEGVRPLGLKRTPGAAALRPSESSIASGAYPLTRALTFVVGRKRTPALRKFLDWVLSPEGQKIVETIGYVPAGSHTVPAGLAN